MDGMQKWSSWSGTPGFPDKKKITAAKSEKLTPIKIDKVDCFGYFQGSHGRYETFLDECDCVDFKRTKSPCKHIYRLAMELRLLGEDFKSDKSKIVIPKASDGYSLEKCIEIANALPEQSQQILYQHLGDIKQGIYQTAFISDDALKVLLDAKILYPADNIKLCLLSIGRNELNSRIDKFGVKYKKNMKNESLVDFCLGTFSEAQLCDVCNDRIAVALEDMFTTNRMGLYAHLHDKFAADEENFWM